METKSETNSSENKTATSKDDTQKKGPNKWEKCLDDYDNYTKEYIKQYKKSLKGNGISLSKYPYMKAKSDALCEKLEKAKNQGFLTEKQLQRISKIQQKIMNTCIA